MLLVTAGHTQVYKTPMVYLPLTNIVSGGGLYSTYLLVRSTC